MGIEHVFVVYDPAKPTNRFDLGFRKAVTKIELVHFESFSGETQPDFATQRANAAAAATAAAEFRPRPPKFGDHWSVSMEPKNHPPLSAETRFEIRPRG